jgi:hypothetical protein
VEVPRQTPDDPAQLHLAPELAVPLRAGPLRVVFDRGELRWIRLGEREVVRGIYFALRAEGWATIPYEMRELEIEAEPASFRVRFQACHARGPVRFEWQARITGSAEGRIVFAIRGTAGSTFLRNRIGLCVLHPAETCAGRPCIVETVDGDRAESVFPALVAPHQPFRNVRAILHEVSPGVEVEVRLDGETFETEDQGNWGDASYKTYGTPLSLPHPVPVRAGASLEQSVSLSLFGITAEPVQQAAATVPGALPKKRNSTEPVLVELGAGEEWALPAIGLAGADGAALSEVEAERLRPLRLGHVRADLQLESPAWAEGLENAVANARLLAVPLELALFLPADAQAVLRELAERASALRPRVGSWLVYRADDRTTGDGLAATAREALVGVDRGAVFGGGSDAHFAELNRRRPLPRLLDRLVFALNPQVHAGDDATLVENLGSLRRMADTLRSFAERTPLGISPVTLRPRVDPSPVAWRTRGERPFTEDPRQDTSLAAAWTLGFLAAAAEAGFASLTFFELTGPRGVQQADRAFPVLDALADIAARPGASVVRARSRRPERVQTLALRSSGGHVRLFLANVTGDAHPVRLSGLSGRASRARLGQPQPAEDSGFELELAPCEIVRLDVEPDGQ